MIRTRVLVGLTALAAAQAPAVVDAANISLSLNLTFNTPGNFASGGTWLVVVKADDRGLAGASMNFVVGTINFNPATGFVGPAGFETQTSASFPGRINIVDGDNPEPPRTLDVGVIGGPFPTTYVDPPNLAVFPGNPDLGSFSGGVRLVTGTFNPGVVPTWFPGPSDVTDGTVYTAPSGLGTVVDANTQTTVRYIVPEPATWLSCLSAALVVLTRGRRRG
jgi:hypothetical protein